MRELNDLEENRLEQLLQLDPASFERLLSLAEERHDVDQMVDRQLITHRIRQELDRQKLADHVRYQIMDGMMTVPKILAGQLKEVTVPVLQLFLGLRSPILGKSELDNHNWFVLTLEPNPTDDDLKRGIKMGLEELRQLNTAQLNGQGRN